MRESRQSGSEGGGAGSNRLSLPLSIGGRYATKTTQAGVVIGIANGTGMG